MKKVLKNDFGGIAVVLLWSVVFFIVVLMCAFVIDVYYTNVKAEIAKDAVSLSANAVYKDINRSDLESGNIVLGDQAVNTFKLYLARNMKLNNDMTARPGSIAVGKIEIDKFEIYKKDSKETLYPDGTEIISKPSLFVRIKFDVEPMLKGIVGSRKTVYTSAVTEFIR